MYTQTKQNDSLYRLKKGVAILSMTSAEPPTQEVTGIGRRIDEDTYWLYEPDGELVSTNT